MNYILIRKNNPKEIHKLDLDEFLEFIGKRPIELYTISEGILNVVAGSNILDIDAYKKTLTFAQINDIQTKKKEIKFSKEIGYYLVWIKEEKEIHYSQMNKVETELEKCKKLVNSCGVNEPHRLSGLCVQLMALLNANNDGTNSSNTLNNENHGGC